MDIDLINSLIEDKIRSDIYTMLPAKVVNVDDYSTLQTISVQPLIGRLYQDGVNLLPQQIDNVPVIMPSAGGAVISFPIKEGDGVCLLFSMRNLDNWEDSDGQDILPTPSTRHHSITDAVAIAGLYTTTSNLKPNPTDVEIKFAGSSWKMKPSGDIEEYVAGNRKIVVAGNYEIESSTLTHNGVNISETHVHEQGVDSDGNTQVDTEVPK